jgi:hypothetical protein
VRSRRPGLVAGRPSLGTADPQQTERAWNWHRAPPPQHDAGPREQCAGPSACSALLKPDGSAGATEHVVQAVRSRFAGGGGPDLRDSHHRGRGPAIGQLWVQLVAPASQRPGQRAQLLKAAVDRRLVRAQQHEHVVLADVRCLGLRVLERQQLVQDPARAQHLATEPAPGAGGARDSRRVGDVGLLQAPPSTRSLPSAT